MFFLLFILLSLNNFFGLGLPKSEPKCPPPVIPCREVSNYLNSKCYYFNCQRESEFEKIFIYLKTKIYGQDEALQQIKTILKPFLLENTKDEKKPLVLHFVGDNGTGKSLTASLLSELLFLCHKGRRKEDRKNLLYQDGQDYSPPRDSSLRLTMIESHSRNLKRKIFQQLRRCPNSIIIIDDIQRMMVEVVDSLLSIFEGIIQYENQQVSSRDAIFIFTSDFGYEDITRNKSLEELKVIIFEKTQEYSLDKKFPHLLQNIPFQSLEKKDISKIIESELLNLPCKVRELQKINFQPQVIEYLSNIWYNYNISRVRNGRGIYNEIVSPRVVQIIDEEIYNLNAKSLYVDLIIDNHELKLISYQVLKNDEL